MMMEKAFYFERWLLQKPNNYYMRSLLYSYIVHYYVDTLPHYKADLSAGEKRRFIRQHINGLKAFNSVKGFKIEWINEYKIYSMTCRILAKKYGLNIRE